MTLGIRILLCLTSQYVISALVYASSPNRIPIGALLDMEIPQAKTGFMYQLDKHNNSSGPNSALKLDRYQKEINCSDPFDFKRNMCSIMVKGLFVIVGFTNSSSLTTMKSYANTFRIPFVTPSALANDTASDIDAASNYILHMRPLYDKAILDIIRKYKWTRIYYLYDTNEGLRRVQSIFQDVNRMGLKLEIEVIQITDPHNSYALLRGLDARYPEKEDNKYIILDLGTLDSLKSVLKQIQNVGMNRDNYHYVLGGLLMDELDLSPFVHGGVNITGFRLLDRKSNKIEQMQMEWSKLNKANPSYWPGMDKKILLDSALTMDAVSVIVAGLGKMLDEDPQVFKNIFRRGQVFNEGKRGVHCDSPETPWVIGPDIMESLKGVDFEGITGKIAFDDHGFRRNYKLDILELGLEREVQKVGTWDDERGLVIERDPTPPQYTNNPNKTKIVTTILSPPYLMRRTESEDGEPLTGNDRFEGYCVDLTKKIAEVVGFDYVLKLVADNKYGANEQDGTWNGMVGELTRGEADLAVAPLTISSKRQRVIDFSKPFMNLGISIMIKKPEKQKPGVFSFMDPLSSKIWMCIVFSYMGVSVVLFLVSRFSPYEWQIEDSVNGPTFTNDFTILNSLWFSLGAFMQQGCDISPRSMSGRIVGSAWWFFTLIIISSYTANLAAFLTVERMLTPIESADDLAKQTEIQYGTLSSGSTQTFFKTSHIAVYERMWQFMYNAEPPVFVDTTEMGVEKVRTSKGKYAFLLESTMNDYHNQKKPCNTMKVGGNLDSKGYGIATPAKSDLKKEINLAVLRLRENGELQKLQKKWWYDKGECNVEADGKGSSQSALTLSNVAGIFYILIGGLGLSMIVSLLEFLYKSKLESKRQQKYAASFRSKTRLSVRGTPDRENGGV